jgi:hypothetical protein
MNGGSATPASARLHRTRHEDALLEPVLQALGASDHEAWWRREVPIEPARADLVAIVRGVLFAVELKSAHDSLTRLPSQLTAYAAVADRVVVACAPKHVEGTLRCIAQTGLRGVGVLSVDGERWTWVDEHGPNEARFVWRVARLLHGQELVAMLEVRGPDAAKGVRGRSKSQVLRRCDALGVTT